MFPVPQHLPRTGGESLSSEIPEKDPVLDLLQPLISQGESSKFTGHQVRDVRSNLERAVKDNKDKTHDILINNFPSISSQIQLSTSLHSDISFVRSKVSSLEAEIDHSDTQTSFLPPLIQSLNRHFSATTTRSSAQAHIKALKNLSKHTERIKKLEEAVWLGKGADEWVLNELQTEKGYSINEEEKEEEALLQGTKIIKAIQAKDELLKSMVIQQITEGFHAAISFAVPTAGQGTTLSVQSTVTLQHPRTTPPPQFEPSTSSHYSLAEIYAALSRLGLLQETLQSLSNRLQKEIIQPVVVTSHKISLSTAEKLSILRLEPNTDSSTSTVLEGVKTILDFTSNTIIPSFSSSDTSGIRDQFLESLHKSAFQSILDFVILPSLPPTLSGISDWLSTIQQAVQVESSFSKAGNEVIKPFFENEAGISWAQQRRYAIADQVRQLILGGWGGWESTEKEQEREVINYIEVEVDDEPIIPPVSSKTGTKGEEDFGRGFDKSPKQDRVDIPAVKPDVTKVESDQAEDINMEDDGWGFEESSSSSAAGPSSPRKASPPPPDVPMIEDEEDGWDLDPSPPTPSSIAEPEPEIAKVSEPVQAPKPSKPAREAKRLGKRVAKVKQEEEYDPWASPDPGEDPIKLANGNHHVTNPPVKITSSLTPPHSAPKQDEGEEGWGWDDDTTSAPIMKDSKKEIPDVSALIPPAPESQMHPQKRKEIREEKSVIKELYLVSTACETLVNIAQSILYDINQLKSSELSSPSFESSKLDITLNEAIKEVFILYRALLPTHFINQLKDVPSLAMQAYNDSIYLSTLLTQFDLDGLTINADFDLKEEKRKLEDLSENIFENQLKNQNQLLIESLTDLNELQNTNEEKIYKKDEKVIKGIIRNLESLDRVIKPVLPSSKHLEMISYLITSLIKQLTNNVLDLVDITEIESNRITELFKFVYQLEHIFDHDNIGGIVRWVEGWLKFCYISEILQASLVDITYLIDSGSLIDFTSAELISLVEALFANSEKRDSVIEKIERDGTSGKADSVH
ncbi:uncharacterized protein L201_000365 [Kwoniella dendrophila CBS 6074]|uniref:ZW10 C-terminal helical domain-containing protein n=1 Tax=Kwoniella dendrophila CBS 6074 TaxID=1295534 RepID=A0AAX4JJ75_9TREE